MSRKTLVRYGIKERLNDLLGTGEGDDFIDWSIQASQIENNKRIVKSLIKENALGKVMSGMRIHYKGSGLAYVDPGYCFDKDGNVIKLSQSTPIPFNQSEETDDIFRIYINYEEAQVSTINGGHSSPSINYAGSNPIIVDNKGANNDADSSIFTVEKNVDITVSGSRVYLGYIKIITVGSLTEDRSVIDNDTDVLTTHRHIINMTGTAGGTSTDWNDSIFAYNNKLFPLSLNHLNGMITLPPGRNIIKSIEVVRRIASTNVVPRDSANISNNNNNPQNFQARMSLMELNSNGELDSLSGFGEVVLEDTVSGYKPYEYNIEYYLPETVRTIAFKTVTTGDSGSEVWSFSSASGFPLENEMFYYTNYGPAQVAITIENLST